MENILDRKNGIFIILPIVNPLLEKTTKSVAYHEAGHAVFGMSIGVGFKSVAINRKKRGGHIKFGDPRPNHQQLIEDLPKDILRASSIECAATTYAGMQAEFILAGIAPTNPCDYGEPDDKQAKEILWRSHGVSHANFYCQQLARKKLLTNWQMVEELAAQLLKHGKITGVHHERTY